LGNRGRPLKYQNRVAVSVYMSSEEKESMDEIVRTEKYHSASEFILSCVREHATLAKSADVLEAEAVKAAQEGKQLEALAAQKAEQAEQAQARLAAMRTLQIRSDRIYQRAEAEAVKHVIAALDNHKELIVAEGNARDLRNRFRVGTTAEDLLAKAYEKARTGGMFR